MTVTTVRRFKGLEAALAVVVDVDLARAVSDEWRRRLYVACSRARHAVHIVTTTRESDLGQASLAFAATAKARPSWRSLSRHLGSVWQEEALILSTNHELGEYDLIRRPEHVARVWSAIEASLPTYWQTFVEGGRRKNPVAQLAAKFGKPVATKAETEGDVLARVFQDAVTSL